ncbi:TPA: hypothetical protein HA265_03130 [Candidatus Woesearchaeota archaeon]|nr:hypothetical protein [Candidatus Woesearchaeota archaeon]
MAWIPISTVRDRSVSIMERVVEHLRDSGMTNQQVAAVLNRSRKTVSTVYTRAKEKRHEEQKS